ncbi:Flagellar biosynthetic protein fliU [Leminorella richardii]|uniref:Flagellar biosynthetic protein fliU n=1 Tax=Leminorella richardii TaxID=158841 RepID=A0A2X4UZ52_9GAMM|nr:flagellin lysine-N-methylase [Leminorella richardii]SQI43679.1 Flagellar biosynthetic protein fliU [Leminorella richardii]
MDIITVYEPEYVRRFQCNGGGCLCTCCIGKAIPLDKTSTRSYLKSQDLTIRGIAQKSIQVKKIDEDNWGTIALNQDNYCPFFDKSRACTYCRIGDRDDLHTRPPFCLDYPYVNVRWQHEVRKSLAIECPEACGQILMSQTSIWTESQHQLSGQSQSPLNDTCQVVNAASIAFVLRPEMTPAERLFAIGQLVLSIPIESYDDGKNAARLKEKLDEQSALLSIENIQHKMNTLPHDQAIRWQVFAEMGAQVARLANSETTPSMASFWEEIYQDIIHQTPESGALKMAMLEESWQNNVLPIFKEYPHVITNYLFYRLYHDAFPYHPHMSSHECYYQLIADCFIIRSLMAYWALTHSRTKKARMIDIVNIYHRWRRQYTNAYQRSANTLISLGLYHPERIYKLLNHW